MSLLDLPDSATVTLTVAELRGLVENGPAPEPSGERLAPLTVAEVAEEVGRSESTVRGWCASGELEAFQVGREWRIRPEALRAMYDRHEDAHNAPDSEPEHMTDPESADVGEWREHAGRGS